MNHLFESYQYFTVNADQLLKWNAAGAVIPDLQWNILVDDHAQLNPNLFECINSMQSGCMISFSDSFFDTQNICDFAAVCSLLSMSNVTNRNSLVPVFSKSNTIDLSKGVQQLSNYLAEQGFENLQIQIITSSSKPCVSLIENCLYVVVDSLADLPTVIRNFKESQAAILVITVTGYHDQLAMFQQVATTLINVDNHWKKTVVNSLDAEMDLWRKRSALYQEFVSIGKAVQEKEYHEVTDWYNKEYESLPLWYKRFGQVIKVIMGKRTLRSLFDNNVKKYKH